MTNESSSPEINPSQSAFDKLERDTGRTLTNQLRGRIKKALQQFVDDCRHQARLVESEHRRFASERRHLEQMVKYLTKTIALIDEMQQKHPGAWNRLADDETDRWRAGLVDLRDGCEKLRKRRKHALPKYPGLWRLLRSLEGIFKDAAEEGTSTGVHVGRKPRHGPFPEFANAVISLLPRSIRPGDITSEWEKFYSGRNKKRTFQVSISSPGYFDMTFTSRRMTPWRARRTTSGRKKTPSKLTP